MAKEFKFDLEFFYMFFMVLFTIAAGISILKNYHVLYEIIFITLEFTFMGLYLYESKKKAKRGEN